MAAQHNWAERPFPLVHTPLKDQPKDYKPNVFEETASDMANAHNLLLRGLNAIYNQAPYIKPSDVTSFLHFCDTWFLGITIHHHGEENDFFPAVEKMCGEEGIMEANVEQHAQFHDGLDGFGRYIKSCLEGNEEFDGQRLVAMIDGFGTILGAHLSDEISTLMGLKRFGDEKMQGLMKALAADAEKNMAKCGLTTGLPMLLACNDVTFEGGRWDGVFPPAPWIILAATRHIFSLFHRDWYKFAPCDKYGQPRAQYATAAAQ